MQRLSYLLRTQIMILLFTYNCGKLPILTLLVYTTEDKKERHRELPRKNNRGVVQALNFKRMEGIKYGQEVS